MSGGARHVLRARLTAQRVLDGIERGFAARRIGDAAIQDLVNPGAAVVNSTPNAADQLEQLGQPAQLRAGCECDSAKRTRRRKQRHVVVPLYEE